MHKPKSCNAPARPLMLRRRDLLLSAAGFAFTSTFAAAESSRAPIKVGLLVALSGPQASGGQRERDPVLFRADEINAAGGVGGRRIQVIVEDNQTSAQVGLTRLNKLIYQDHVSAIIGDVGSAVMAYSPILARAGVPFVFNGATLSVTEHGNKWLYRDIPSDRYVVIQMLRYLREQAKATRVALLMETSAYGEGAAQMFLEYSKRPDLAVEIVAHEKYQINDVDLTAHVTKIKGTNPQALVLWGASAAGAVALRNAKSIGLDVPTIAAVGMIQPGVLAAAGPAAEGLIAGSYGLVPNENIDEVASATRTLKNFVKNFGAKYPGREISFWELMSYDAMLIIEAGLKRAGSDDRAKLRDAIEGIQKLEGTLGYHSFSPENHDGVKEDAIVVMRFSGGKWKRLWPK
jgi:branched-chain amino acid transport system substrate-binding protein